ncbi:NADP-dependent oxidoreductase domain containing protein [Tylopilus felleus]
MTAVERGIMTLGFEGKNGVRMSSLAECQEIIDVFFDHGHSELDTAQMYVEGTTEQILSQLNLRGAMIDTKVYPVNPSGHSPENLRNTFMMSLQYLKCDKVRVLYLHAPDRSVPFKDTVCEINNLYKEGRFEIFGLSNFAAWEVVEVVGICKTNGYVLPKIYQARYNTITREIEPKLVPCCRKYGIRLVIYNPLVGGLFAGKVNSVEEQAPEGSCFNPASSMGKMYHACYFREGYFKALELLKGVMEKHNLCLTKIALRWCQHHSRLNVSIGVILGASSAVQLKQNCKDSVKGPLPQEVVDALDEACKIVKAHESTPLYWH